MALDIYSWLAQRLHRIPEWKSPFIPWTSLNAQFGAEYDLQCQAARSRKVELARRVQAPRCSGVHLRGRLQVSGNRPSEAAEIGGETGKIAAVR
jgi:hypothetical protein